MFDSSKRAAQNRKASTSSAEEVDSTFLSPETTLAEHNVGGFGTCTQSYLPTPLAECSSSRKPGEAEGISGKSMPHLGLHYEKVARFFVSGRERSGKSREGLWRPENSAHRLVLPPPPRIAVSPVVVCPVGGVPFRFGVCG